MTGNEKVGPKSMILSASRPSLPQIGHTTVTLVPPSCTILSSRLRPGREFCTDWRFRW
jgi:hypothetical protein